MLFKLVNKRLEAIGFIVTFDGRSVIEYQRRGSKYRNYTHKVTLRVGYNDVVYLRSFDPLERDGRHNSNSAIELSDEELKLFMTAVKLFKLRYKLGSLKRI